MKFILSLTIVICSALGLFAQQPTPTPTAKPLIQRRCCGQRFPKRVVNRIATPQPTPAAPDFFVGDAKVELEIKGAQIQIWKNELVPGVPAVRIGGPVR